MKPLLLPILLGTLLLSACNRKAPAGGPPPGMKIAVRTSVAIKEPVQDRLSLVASVTASERVDVRSPVEGTIANVMFDEGQPIKKGQPMFQLDTRKWVAFLAEAQASFKAAEADRARAERMFAAKTISQQELDAAVARHDMAAATLTRMRKQLEDALIVAEFDGVTGSRAVSVGQVVTPQTVLTSLVDVDPVKVGFAVPERHAGQLKPGQRIQFSVPAYPGRPFDGEVYFIAPEVDTKSRTIDVKARAANADAALKPGMFGRLELVMSERPDVLMIPETALVPQGESVSVFIVDEAGLAQSRVVKTGLRVPGRVEILEGLQSGEMVIVEGVQKVRPGAAVDPKPVDVQR